MDIIDIKKIIEHMERLKYTVTVKDISYCVLDNEFNNPLISYKAVFRETANETVVNKFNSSQRICVLKKYLLDNYLKKKKTLSDINIEDEDSDDSNDDFSLEENRAGLIKLLKRIKKSVSEGVLDEKDALKYEADFRLKLDKLNSKGETKEQERIVVVEPKFNYICPYTSRECYIHSKEECMKRYDLIDNPYKDNNNE